MEKKMPGLGHLYKKEITRLYFFQMGKVFGCSLPFLQPDPRFNECRLDKMDETKRGELWAYYAGEFPTWFLHIMPPVWYPLTSLVGQRSLMQL